MAGSLGEAHAACAPALRVGFRLNSLRCGWSMGKRAGVWISRHGLFRYLYLPMDEPTRRARKGHGAVVGVTNMEAGARVDFRVGPVKGASVQSAVCPRGMCEISIAPETRS